MKLVDKIKNIFFEEEEEEEVEDTRPIPKVREKEVKKEKEVIAKKVEIPRRKREKEEVNEVIEEIKSEIPKKEKEIENYVEIPKEEPPKKEPKITEMIFEDEDFVDIPKEEPKKIEQPQFKTRESRETFIEKEVMAPPPSYDYPKKEEPKKVGGFTPSPIISPIYGILDKNYRKEEVKENKEIRITSRVSRMDLDSVRNKAFGDLENELFSRNPDTEEEEEESKEDLTKLRDKIEDDGKPVIDKVTLGEADEYYTDLGLAYNTDYKDVSKEINDGKVKKEKKEKGDKLEDNLFDLIETMYDKED